MATRLHDHRGGNDCPAGRRDTHLIDSDDAGQTLIPETAFVAEGRDDDGHRPSG
jgi:hypothetical protein